MNVTAFALQGLCLEFAQLGLRRTYGDVAEHFGGDRRNLGDLLQVVRGLRAITDEDAAHGRPLIAATVVNARTGLPGLGFRDQAIALDCFDGGNYAEFVAHEWARCVAHYGAQLEPAA